MIFSTTAVRSLSSVLVVAMAATTPFSVRGATTTNRKLSKNSLSSTAPPTTKCPSAKLYYPFANNNTTNIRQSFSGQLTLGVGQVKICYADGLLCIGDTFTHFITLYADEDLTEQVATLGSTAKVVNVKDDGTQVHVITASLVYDDTNAELIYGGYIDPNQDIRREMAVSGGTRECALTFGTIDFSSSPENNYSTVEFQLVDLKMLMN